MNKSLVASALSLALFGFSAAAGADDDDRGLRFDGGIGVIPVSSAVGITPQSSVVNRNIVRNVQPAGQLWTIRDLRAHVRSDGSIRVDGRGLLLAGGNGIGSNANNAKVFATLICEAAAPFVERNTMLTGVQLEPDGDFRIDDMLTPAAPPECTSPVLLIRNAANQAWFAAGIPKR
jgi:hypothetical protein